MTGTVVSPSLVWTSVTDESGDARRDPYLYLTPDPTTQEKISGSFCFLSSVVVSLTLTVFLSMCLTVRRDVSPVRSPVRPHLIQNKKR